MIAFQEFTFYYIQIAIMFQSGLTTLSIHTTVFFLDLILFKEITNGFKSAFDYVTGEFVRVMCWAHVYRAVELKLSSIKDKSISQQILLDIEHLQVSYTPKLFEYAYKLFTEKYKKLNNKDVDYFLEYFHKEWISSSNSGWYEGVAINIPSTDNGLESKNAQIKSHYTLRSRLSIDEYLNNAKTMLFDWSKDAIDEESKFKNSVSKTIIENSYIKAFNYLMNKPIMKKFNNQK